MVLKVFQMERRCVSPGVCHGNVNKIVSTVYLRVYVGKGEVTIYNG